MSWGPGAAESCYYARNSRGQARPRYSDIMSIYSATNKRIRKKGKSAIRKDKEMEWQVQREDEKEREDEKDQGQDKN